MTPQTFVMTAGKKQKKNTNQPPPDSLPPYLTRHDRSALTWARLCFSLPPESTACAQESRSRLHGSSYGWVMFDP